MNSQLGDITGPERGDRTGGLDALGGSGEFRGPVEPFDDHDHANGHVALIYETDAERFAAVVPFVREGLERGEQCVYVLDDEAERSTVVEALREGGVDVDDALDSGALTFYTAAETYLRSEPFDPDGMMDFYADTVEDVLDEYEGFRVVAGTSWIDEVPLETFMEYEGRVNTIFAEHDAKALCHYDRTELPADVIRDVVRTHPRLVYDGDVCHNFYYVPPEELLDVEDATHEVDRMLGTLQDRTRARADLAAHEQFLRKLTGIMASGDRSFEEKLQALFDLGCAQFDLELGGLNRVDPDADRFRVEYLSGEDDFFEPGLELPLSETYCRAPADAMDTASVSDPVGEGFDDIAIYEECGAEAYLGTHISVDGGDDRTFAFITSEARTEPFSEADRTYIELMGQWVKYELEHRHDRDQLAALNNLNGIARDINRELVQQSTREEIERVVCEHLAASDSYELAWIGTVDDGTGMVVPSTTASDGSGLDAVSAAANSETGAAATTALRTGETQITRDVGGSAASGEDDGGSAADGEDGGSSAAVDPPPERRRDGDVAASASVPIVYEDRTYGVLNVYTARTGAFDDEERAVITQLGEIVGLTVATVEREEALEHERERLELINRLLRHNLLNGLNLVGARLDVLEGRVDFEALDHLETARGRTDEMIDLIETLRELTEGLVDDDHEVGSVDLGRILQDELERARAAHDGATFDVDADLDAVPPVLADDLLAEVFENLLDNAVRHNDKEAPRVTVDVTTDEESVTVRVGDNGPGVPEGLQETIFEKGQTVFERPGTGFGLHLVREIVDAYDGTIAVENDDSEGTVFAVSLPLAGGE